MDPRDKIPTSTLVIVARHLIKNWRDVGEKYALDGIEHIRQTLNYRAKTNADLDSLAKDFNAHFHYGE